MSNDGIVGWAEAANAIKGTQQRSQALAKLAVTLVNSAQNWTVENMAELACDTERLLRQLVQCDQLTFYHVQDSALTLTHWEALELAPQPLQPSEEVNSDCKGS